MSKRWASDDEADDLLAGILDETAADAADEEQRIADELQARRDAEAKRLAKAKAEKKRAAEVRLSAERERQKAIHERRTLKMKALEPGLPELTPAVEKTAERVPEPREKQVVKAPPGASAEVTPTAVIEPVTATSSFRGLRIVAVVAAVLGSILAMAHPGEYELDRQQYVKAIYAPKDATVALVEKGYELVPSPSVTSPRAVRDARPRIARPARVRVEERPAAENEASERASRLEELLKDSSDPFGMGP